MVYSIESIGHIDVGSYSYLPFVQAVKDVIR